MYLSAQQLTFFKDLLQAFFRLPYSTDLDGKDAETLIRIVKNITGTISKRKELFDIIDEPIGYSVKTLKKPLSATRVDLQEQRLGDVEGIRGLRALNTDNAASQGKLLLEYMVTRIRSEMARRHLTQARSLILLKNWNAAKTHYHFRYWEEDFLGYVETLYARNAAGEIEWVKLDKGLHGRDKLRQDAKGVNVRLLRMHYKHNQIFTDHDIPTDAAKMSFQSSQLPWSKLIEIMQAHDNKIITQVQGDLSTLL